MVSRNNKRVKHVIPFYGKKTLTLSSTPISLKNETHIRTLKLSPVAFKNKNGSSSKVSGLQNEITKAIKSPLQVKPKHNWKLRKQARVETDYKDIFNTSSSSSKVKKIKAGVQKKYVLSQSKDGGKRKTAWKVTGVKEAEKGKISGQKDKSAEEKILLADIESIAKPTNVSKNDVMKNKLFRNFLEHKSVSTQTNALQYNGNIHSLLIATNNDSHVSDQGHSSKSKSLLITKFNKVQKNVRNSVSKISFSSSGARKEEPKSMVFEDRFSSFSQSTESRSQKALERAMLPANVAASKANVNSTLGHKHGKKKTEKTRQIRSRNSENLKSSRKMKVKLAFGKRRPREVIPKVTLIKVKAEKVSSGATSFKPTKLSSRSVKPTKLSSSTKSIKPTNLSSSSISVKPSKLPSRSIKPTKLPLKRRTVKPTKMSLSTKSVKPTKLSSSTTDIKSAKLSLSESMSKNRTDKLPGKRLRNVQAVKLSSNKTLRNIEDKKVSPQKALKFVEVPEKRDAIINISPIVVKKIINIKSERGTPCSKRKSLTKMVKTSQLRMSNKKVSVDLQTFLPAKSVTTSVLIAKRGSTQKSVPKSSIVSQNKEQTSIEDYRIKSEKLVNTSLTKRKRQQNAIDKVPSCKKSRISGPSSVTEMLKLSTSKKTPTNSKKAARKPSVARNTKTFLTPKSKLDKISLRSKSQASLLSCSVFIPKLVYNKMTQKPGTSSQDKSVASSPGKISKKSVTSSPGKMSQKTETSSQGEISKKAVKISQIEAFVSQAGKKVTKVLKKKLKNKVPNHRHRISTLSSSVTKKTFNKKRSRLAKAANIKRISEVYLQQKEFPGRKTQTSIAVSKSSNTAASGERNIIQEKSLLQRKEATQPFVSKQIDQTEASKPISANISTTSLTKRVIQNKKKAKITNKKYSNRKRPKLSMKTQAKKSMSQIQRKTRQNEFLDTENVRPLAVKQKVSKLKPIKNQATEVSSKEVLQIKASPRKVEKATPPISQIQRKTRQNEFLDTENVRPLAVKQKVSKLKPIKNQATKVSSKEVLQIKASPRKVEKATPPISQIQRKTRQNEFLDTENVRPLAVKQKVSKLKPIKNQATKVSSKEVLQIKASPRKVEKATPPISQIQRKTRQNEFLDTENVRPLAVKQKVSKLKPIKNQATKVSLKEALQIKASPRKVKKATPPMSQIRKKTKLNKSLVIKNVKSFSVAQDSKLQPAENQSLKSSSTKIRTAQGKKKQADKQVAGDKKVKIQETVLASLFKQSGPLELKKTLMLKSSKVTLGKKRSKLSIKANTRKSLSQSLKRARLSKVSETLQISPLSTGMVGLSIPLPTRMHLKNDTLSLSEPFSGQNKTLIPNPGKISGRRPKLSIKTKVRKSPSLPLKRARHSKVSELVTEALKPLQSRKSAKKAKFSGSPKIRQALQGKRNITKQTSKKVLLHNGRRLISPGERNAGTDLTPEKVLLCKDSPALTRNRKTNKTLSPSGRKRVTTKPNIIAFSRMEPTSHQMLNENQLHKTRSSKIAFAGKKKGIAKPKPRKSFKHKISSKLTKSPATKYITLIKQKPSVIEANFETNKLAHPEQDDESKKAQIKNEMREITIFAANTNAVSSGLKKNAQIKIDRTTLYKKRSKSKLEAKKSTFQANKEAGLSRMAKGDKISMISPIKKWKSKQLPVKKQTKKPIQAKSSKILSVSHERMQITEKVLGKIILSKDSPTLLTKKQAKKVKSQSLQRGREGKTKEILAKRSEVSPKLKNVLRPAPDTNRILKSLSHKKAVSAKRKKNIPLAIVKSKGSQDLRAKGRARKALLKTRTRKSKASDNQLVSQDTSGLQTFNQTPSKVSAKQTQSASSPSKTISLKKCTSRLINDTALLNKKGKKLSGKDKAKPIITETPERTRICKTATIKEIKSLSPKREVSSKFSSGSKLQNNRLRTPWKKEASQEIKRRKLSTSNKLRKPRGGKISLLSPTQIETELLQAKKQIKRGKSDAVLNISNQKTELKSESTKGTIKASLKPSRIVHPSKRSIGATQSLSRKNITVSPLHSVTKAGSSREEYLSFLQRAAEIPPLITDLAEKRYLERKKIAETSPARSKIAETSPARSESTYSGLGRKSYLLKFNDTDYSFQTKDNSHILNLSQPSRAVVSGKSYKRQDGTTPTSKVNVRTELRHMSYSSTGSSDPSLLDNATASQAWNEEISFSDASKGAAALPINVAKNYIRFAENTPSSHQWKSETTNALLEGSRNNDNDGNKVITKGSSLLKKHLLPSEVKSQELTRSGFTYRSDGRNFNVAKQSVKVRFGVQITDEDDNFEGNEEEELEDISDERDEGRFVEGKATPSHGEHSQRCTIS